MRAVDDSNSLTQRAAPQSAYRWAPRRVCSRVVVMVRATRQNRITFCGLAARSGGQIGLGCFWRLRWATIPQTACLLVLIPLSPSPGALDQACYFSVRHVPVSTTSAAVPFSEWNTTSKTGPDFCHSHRRTSKHRDFAPQRTRFARRVRPARINQISRHCQHQSRFYAQTMPEHCHLWPLQV